MQSCPCRSTNESRWRRFESFGTVLFSPSEDRALSSVANTVLCTAPTITLLACSNSTAEGGGRGLVSFLELSPFFFLNCLVDED